MLNRSVPRFHIRVLEVLINYKIGGCFSWIGNDPGRWNQRLNETGETFLESSGSSIRKHRRAKGRNRRVELVIGPHGKVVGVAVVGEWRVANAESNAEDRRFLQTVS